jgi:hypothetical protein
MLLTRLPWLAELNHDAIDRESARKGALQSLGTAPLAATALLRAQLVANRPMLGAVRGGASVGAVLRGLSAQRATALAVQRHPGELFGWAQAARPSGTPLLHLHTLECRVNVYAAVLFGGRRSVSRRPFE